VGRRQQKGEREKITDKKVYKTLKGKRFSFQSLFLIKNPQLRGIPTLRVHCTAFSSRISFYPFSLSLPSSLSSVIIIFLSLLCQPFSQTFIFQKIEDDDDDNDIIIPSLLRRRAAF
jgi:hypothetical protein